jgi:hypothetical protein
LTAARTERKNNQKQGKKNRDPEKTGKTDSRFPDIVYRNGRIPKKEEKTVEDRKNGQKRQPEARRPEEDRARKPIELDPDQMEKVSGGAPSIPPEWLMKDE